MKEYKVKTEGNLVFNLSESGPPGFTAADNDSLHQLLYVDDDGWYYDASGRVM